MYFQSSHAIVILQIGFFIVSLILSITSLNESHPTLSSPEKMRIPIQTKQSLNKTEETCLEE